MTDWSKEYRITGDAMGWNIIAQFDRPRDTTALGVAFGILDIFVTDLHRGGPEVTTERFRLGVAEKIKRRLEGLKSSGVIQDYRFGFDDATMPPMAWVTDVMTSELQLSLDPTAEMFMYKFEYELRTSKVRMFAYT